VKKMMIVISVLLFLTMILCGCEEDEEELNGDDSNFIGTWKTDAESFTMGDSIRFNEDYSCDFFWDGGYSILFSGKWNRTFISGHGHCIVINMSSQQWTYEYNFFDSYKTLRLKMQDSDTYISYRKQ